MVPDCPGLHESLCSMEEYFEKRIIRYERNVSPVALKMVWLVPPKNNVSVKTFISCGSEEQRSRPCVL